MMSEELSIFVSFEHDHRVITFDATFFFIAEHPEIAQKH